MKSTSDTRTVVTSSSVSTFPPFPHYTFKCGLVSQPHANFAGEEPFVGSIIFPLGGQKIVMGEERNDFLKIKIRCS